MPFTNQNTAVADRIQSPVARMALKGWSLAKVYAPAVVHQLTDYGDAVFQIVAEMLRERDDGLSLDPVHRLPNRSGLPERVLDYGRIEAFVERALDRWIAAYEERGASALRVVR